MGDAHKVVVHHVGKVICGELIALHDHWITLGIADIVVHLAVNEIIQWFLVIRQLEADTVGRSLGQEGIDFRLSEMTALVIIAWNLPGSQRLLTQQIQTAFGAETSVSGAVQEEFLYGFTGKEKEYIYIVYLASTSYPLVTCKSPFDDSEHRVPVDRQNRVPRQFLCPPREDPPPGVHWHPAPVASDPYPRSGAEIFRPSAWRTENCKELCAVRPNAGDPWDWGRIEHAPGCGRDGGTAAAGIAG